MQTLSPIESGFTLPELLVVVVVLGILASVGAGGFQSLIQSQQVKNASFELFSSLSLARSEAIKRNDTVTVTLTPPDANWGKGWKIKSSADQIIKSQSELKKIFISQDSASVVYHPTGRATLPTPFLIDVSTTPTANARCIKIELSGMPRAYPSNNGIC